MGKEKQSIAKQTAALQYRKKKKRLTYFTYIIGHISPQIIKKKNLFSIKKIKPILGSQIFFWNCDITHYCNKAYLYYIQIKKIL